MLSSFAEQNVTVLKSKILLSLSVLGFWRVNFAMRPTNCPDALRSICLVVSDDLQNRNNLQRKVRRAGLSDLGEEKRCPWLTNFIYDWKKLNWHVQADSNKWEPDKLQAALDWVPNMPLGRILGHYNIASKPIGVVHDSGNWNSRWRWDSELMSLQNEVEMTDACWQCWRAVNISFGSSSSSYTNIFWRPLDYFFLLQIVLLGTGTLKIEVWSQQAQVFGENTSFSAVLRILERIHHSQHAQVFWRESVFRIRIHMFLGLPDPDPSIIMQ